MSTNWCNVKHDRGPLSRAVVSLERSRQGKKYLSPSNDVPLHSSPLPRFSIENLRVRSSYKRRRVCPIIGAYAVLSVFNVKNNFPVIVCVHVNLHWV